ncbi:MAG TPA: hypothetical protein EYP19_04085, partial [Desulfobacterales bacterium]|nr:hypothetical protein [Desulfobacterales bacterium]
MQFFSLGEEAAMESGPYEAQRDELKFFRRLPWEKMTIWTIFLLIIYALRGFFDIIVITFVPSYIAKNIVWYICTKTPRLGNRPWFRQTIVAFIFLGLLAFIAVVAPSIFRSIYEDGYNLLFKLERVTFPKPREPLVERRISHTGREWPSSAIPGTSPHAPRAETAKTSAIRKDIHDETTGKQIPPPAKQATEKAGPGQTSSQTSGSEAGAETREQDTAGKQVKGSETTTTWAQTN